MGKVECQAWVGIRGCSAGKQEIVDFLLALYCVLWHLKFYEVAGRSCRIGIVGIEGVGVCVLKPHGADTEKLVGAATSSELHVVHHPCGGDASHVLRLPLVVHGSCRYGWVQHLQIGEHL